MYFSLIFLLSFFIFNSCAGRSSSLVEDNPPIVQITLDKKTYTFTPTLSIIIRIKNTADKSVFYDSCARLYIEEIVDGKVINSWLTHARMCFHPTELPAGNQIESEFKFEHMLSRGEFMEKARLGEGVEYRFKFDPFLKENKFIPENRLGDENRFSNSFTLLAPDDSDKYK